MKISSVNENVIWHKRRNFFYKVSLLHAKMVRVWLQKTLFVSEHATLYFYRSKSCLQILKTTEYQLNNDVTITSFCYVNKSCLANSLFSNKSDSAVTCMQLTVQISSTKTFGRQIVRAWIRLTIMFGGRCCRTSVTSIRSPELKSALVKIWVELYHKTQSASRSAISGSVCEVVWTQMADILSIYCNIADWFDLCLLFLHLWKQKRLENVAINYMFINFTAMFR